MSRYYRTSMGDDPASAPAMKAETKPMPEGMPQARKHSRRPQPATAPMPDGDAPPSTPTSAPPRVLPPHPVTAMPVRRAPTSKRRDKHLALLKEDVGPSKSSRRLLLVGGAVVGLGALMLLFSGGGERGRKR